MRLRSRVLGGVLLLLAGACHEDALVAPAAPSIVMPPPQLSAAPGRSAVTLVRSPESGKADRVGPDDGALRPDGVPDIAFVAEAEGPIAAIFLVSVDDQGNPDGRYHADTLIGETPGPADLGARPGAATSGIGVAEEGNALLNAKDGSLAVLRAGPHRLVLYVAQTATLTFGVRVRAYAQRPDGTLIASAPVVVTP